MTARILPSQEYLRECFRYDEDIGALFWRVRPVSHFKAGKGRYTAKHTATRWNARCDGKRFGCIVEAPPDYFYRCGRLNGKTWPECKLIWRLLKSDDPPEIDHWDNDALNNKISNLREATRSQNNMNRRAGHKERALPKGVDQPRKGRFRARIKLNGKTIDLGRFASPEEAHAKYCKAAVELHNEFANFGSN